MNNVNEVYLLALQFSNFFAKPAYNRSTMVYYQVLAGSLRFHGEEALTYSSEIALVRGAIVEVPLRNQQVLGIVLGSVSEPKFKTKLITKIYELPPLPEASLKLMDWLRAYYPAPLGAITNQFLPGNLTNKLPVSQDKAEFMVQPLPKLTEEQSEVIARIKAQPKQNSFFLHGDTGTGKTRVYLELAKQQLEAGKDVLILTPEIGLTPQLVKDFEKTFSQQVVVWHSNLTPAQRRKAWLHILQASQPTIVIGPRSALFAPFHKLGLIVIDEAHESAYKQEQQPHYQAIRVAGQLANIHGATLILGTATPNVTDYYIAEAKKVPILRMRELAVKTSDQNADIKIIDAKNKTHFGRNYLLSDELIDGVADSLKRGQQSLVFLNRRGTARLILCQNCGWEQHCPNCDLPLTYHGDDHIMRCHTCGFKAAAPVQCPVCKSSDIIYKNVGTKSLVEILAKLFPEASIQRFDTDNIKEEQLAQHYKALAAGEVDIIVGTQLITKGLDLPKLGMVGVVTADSALSFPDYTADERTYQLLRQVIGRIGRGHQVSQAVVQTYHPDNPTILAATSKDWDNFYASQIKERQTFRFPPFCYLLKLTTNRKTPQAAAEAAAKLKTELQRLDLKIEVIGPSPSFYEKSRDGYRWQLTVKTKIRFELIEVIKRLPSGWSYNLDPTNLL